MIINSDDDDINFSIKLVLEEIEYEKVGGNDTATTNISTIHKIRVYPFSNPVSCYGNISTATRPSSIN